MWIRVTLSRPQLMLDLPACSAECRKPITSIRGVKSHRCWRARVCLVKCQPGWPIDDVALNRGPLKIADAFGCVGAWMFMRRKKGCFSKIFPERCCE